MKSYCFTSKRDVTIRDLRLCYAIHNLFNIKGIPQVQHGKL